MSGRWEGIEEGGGMTKALHEVDPRKRKNSNKKAKKNTTEHRNQVSV